MPPDRLSELRRQRDLIRAHLHWLEAEIAGASPEAIEPATNHIPPEETNQPRTAPAAANDGPLPVVETANVQNEVRRGCLVYVAIAVAFGVGLIAFIYWGY